MQFNTKVKAVEVTCAKCGNTETVNASQYTTDKFADEISFQADSGYSHDCSECGTEMTIAIPYEIGHVLSEQALQEVQLAIGILSKDPVNADVVKILNNAIAVDGRIHH